MISIALQRDFSDRILEPDQTSGFLIGHVPYLCNHLGGCHYIFRSHLPYSPFLSPCGRGKGARGKVRGAKRAPQHRH